jgi:exportin-1
VPTNLLRSCLRTLQAFIPWIPLEYVFDSPLIENLLNKYMHQQSTRMEVIKVFTEVVSIDMGNLP